MSRTRTDSKDLPDVEEDDEEETSDLEMEQTITVNATATLSPLSPPAKYDKATLYMHRMNAIDTDYSSKDKHARVPVTGPKFAWLDSKQSNTIDIQKTEEANKKMLEYLATFDPAMKEVVMLLSGDSLLRFYDTDDYQRILEEHMANTNGKTKSVDEC